jgi:hypothetical protein
MVLVNINKLVLTIKLHVVIVIKKYIVIIILHKYLQHKFIYLIIFFTINIIIYRIFNSMV